MILHLLKPLVPSRLWAILKRLNFLLKLVNISSLPNFLIRPFILLNVSYNIEKFLFLRKISDIECERIFTKNFAIEENYDGLKYLIIVPSDYNSEHLKWESANGNFYYEICQRGKEQLGQSSVLPIFVEYGNQKWLESVQSLIASNPRVHIVFPLEFNFSTQDVFDWHLIVDFWRSCGWRGISLPLIFDSVWNINIIKIRFLASRDCRILPIIIDRDAHSILQKSISSVSPTLIPISIESLNILDSHLLKSSNPSKYPITFIGKIYEYRKETLDEFLRLDIPVAINPHLQSNFSNNYKDYIRVLAESESTLILCRANAQNIMQLKSRVLEASLFGTYLLVDDKNQMERIEMPLSCYRYYKNGAGLKKFLNSYANEEISGLEGRKIRSDYARRVLNSIFWENIEHKIRDLRT